MRTNNVVMVRPASFGFNGETARSNSFQVEHSVKQEDILEEFDGAVLALREFGVNVLVIDDTPDSVKPDAIFPNNWLQLRWDNKAVVFPMLAENRRLERRQEIPDVISGKFQMNSIVDLSVSEDEGRFLEGTGSVVFDHYEKVAYACVSPRTNEELARDYISSLDYTPIIFRARSEGLDIYHTNVVMAVTEHFLVICIEAIEVKDQILFSGGSKPIMEISREQMNNFAGNMLELEDGKGNPLLVLSERALGSLKRDQVQMLSEHHAICTLAINNIERIGGGSARCMIAENFLNKK